MFAIRMKNTDYWCPKSQYSYFIEDDEGHRLLSERHWNDENGVDIGHAAWAGKHFGTKQKYRKVWETTESMRRSLRHLKGETCLNPVGSIGSATIEVIEPDNNKIGSFSHYEVVDIVTNTVYTLEDVFNKAI